MILERQREGIAIAKVARKYKRRIAQAGGHRDRAAEELSRQRHGVHALWHLTKADYETVLIPQIEDKL